MIQDLRTTRSLPENLEQTLVDQTLSASDARDLLSSLIDASVQHHKLANLRSQVRTENPNWSAKQHIDELHEKRVDLRLLLAEIQRRGLQVRVRTSIDLVVESDPLAAVG